MSREPRSSAFRAAVGPRTRCGSRPSISLAFRLVTGGAQAPGASLPFLILWLIGWLIGGAYVLLSFLWIVFGEESVRVAGDTLTAERRVFGLRWTRAFDRAAVKHLRVLCNPPSPWWQQRNRRQVLTPLQSRGDLGFDYGAETYRFGQRIGSEGAVAVVDRLNAALHR